MTAVQRQAGGLVTWLRTHRLLGFLPREETTCPPLPANSQFHEVARDLDQLEERTAALLAAQRRLIEQMHEERHARD